MNALQMISERSRGSTFEHAPASQTLCLIDIGFRLVVMIPQFQHVRNDETVGLFLVFLEIRGRRRGENILAGSASGVGGSLPLLREILPNLGTETRV